MRTGFPNTKVGSKSTSISTDMILLFIFVEIISLSDALGISENLLADIVGHDKPRITYGLYSGGSSLE